MRRTFATETTQFLAPYEVSQKNRPTTEAITAVAQSPTAATAATATTTNNSSLVTSGSEHNIQQTFQAPSAAAAIRPSQLSSSLSSSDLCKSGSTGSGTLATGQPAAEPAMRKGIANWNPFHDPQPFSQMTEDHIFDAEFEAIRHRGSQSSEFYFYFVVLT